MTTNETVPAFAAAAAVVASAALGITYSSGFYTLEYRINSGTYTAIGSGGTFSVSNGQTVNFRATWDGMDIVSYDVVTITNQSAAGTPTLDTFGVSLTV
mgnify:CR=1 FL=1